MIEVNETILIYGVSVVYMVGVLVGMVIAFRMQRKVNRERARH